MMTTSPMTTTSSPAEQLEIFEPKPGLRFTVPVLKMLLPDVETALFFGKVYDLTAQQLADVLKRVFNTPLIQALTSGYHSTDLQGYLLDPGWLPPSVSKGSVSFSPTVPQGEVLPELWKSLEVEVAQSIQDVAAKLQSVVGLMPGKKGSMVFNSLMTMNRRRPTLGDYRAKIHHAPIKENLVIMDVSGSMTSETVRQIVDDVVALSYEANAHMAVVSNTTTHWDPGSFTSDNVLRASEFGGTHYETLVPLLDSRDWGVVVAIADYDSSPSALSAVRSKVNRRIEQVLDVSLVNRPTYLGEVLGHVANEVRPILVAPSGNVLGSGRGSW